MRIPRVFTEQDLGPGAEVTLEARPSHHLLRVLRLRPGDTLQVFAAGGGEYPARLEAIEEGQARIRLGDPLPSLPDPPLRPHLLIGISKGERMDFALQKATELGVVRITPLWTARVVVRLQGGRLKRRLEHWSGILTAAAEQSGRRDLPRLDPPRRLSEVLSEEPPGSRLLLHHQAPVGLKDLPPVEGPVALLVGPEGGLAAAERDAAEARGFTPIRLGPRILRTETAPLAALAAIQVLWGDLG